MEKINGKRVKIKIYAASRFVGIRYEKRFLPFSQGA